jgi:hypothetical protein
MVRCAFLWSSMIIHLDLTVIGGWSTKNWLPDQLSMSVQEVMSVLEIDSTDGLSDPKLGATVNHKRQARCATCDAGPADCPGHFGHLVLAKPIFHIGFMLTVLAVLRCVCISCSRLLANQVRTIMSCCNSTHKCSGCPVFGMLSGSSAESAHTVILSAFHHLQRQITQGIMSRNRTVFF